MANVTMREVRVQGVRSPVRQSGPESAREAVVFVHGNPGSGEDYAELLPSVGELARAVAPDMPGYGKADRPKGFDYTVEGYARHLDGVLSELGVERAHLVLHDFGGPWGLAWAAAHPERVASLTLLNVGVLPGYRWHKFARLWRTPIVGELFQLAATWSAFKLLTNADNPKPFPEAFLRRMFDDQDWPMKVAVLKLYRATPDLGGLTERLGAALRPLSLPTLVLWGEGDAYLPVKHAEEQKRYFDAEVHVIPNAGHWPMVDEPGLVRDHLVAFLKKRLGAAKAA
jgi:pimeloyl-ACP methyl ester carboxylesterase